METAKNKNILILDLQPAPLKIKLTRFVKRAFDILVSVFGLLFLAPFFIFIIVLIKREGPGPIFYRGPRSGRHGQEFGILKFRTMYERPASYQGPRVTAQDDDRITPLGKWLRDTKLNELPQLWNVFVGEMSLVGPRPEDPEIVKTWSPEAQAEILSVTPGITSPASILYRNEETMLPADGVMDAYFRDIVPDKIRLDRLYVRNHTFIGDLDILFWTAVALIPAISKYKIPEGDLYVGPLARIVRRYFSWFVLDFLVCLIAITLISVVWRLFGPIDWGVIPLAILALCIAFFFSAVNSLFGLDRVYWSRAGADDGFWLVISNWLSSIFLFLLNSIVVHYPHWFPIPALPHEIIFLISAFALAGSLILRYRLRLITSLASRWLSWRGGKKNFGERILILGAGMGGEIAHWLIQHTSDPQLFSVVGMVDDDPAKRGMKIRQSWVLGSISEIPSLVKKHDVGVIVFAISDISQEVRDRIVRVCHLPNVRLIYLRDILNTVQNKISGTTALGD
jgi:lipopolysaccharide/colanic/teichoic acid biosynthesis glycosyltransferase